MVPAAATERPAASLNQGDCVANDEGFHREPRRVEVTGRSSSLDVDGGLEQHRSACRSAASSARNDAGFSGLRRVRLDLVKQRTDAELGGNVPAVEVGADGIPNSVGGQQAGLHQVGRKALAMAQKSKPKNHTAM